MIPFLKGHGTENDFVLLPDADGALDLTESRVRALCDRRRGLGADGVLRVVREDGRWFMDYRNADGSIAEMCGNGVRVFAAYLRDAGLVDGPEFTIGTRAGERTVVLNADGTVRVGMGAVRVGGESWADVAGHTFSGIVVDVGNPHLACVSPDIDLRALDLRDQPAYDAAVFPHGVNVEFVVPEADGLRMRVHERGVGETRSCGTGTVAAVAAALHRRGESTGRSVVRVPGGEVVVEIGPDGATLTGPAVFVARGEIDQDWWAGS